MTEFSVRRATSDDAVALGELGALLVHAHHQYDARRFMTPGPRIHEGYGRFLVSQLDRSDAVVLVAERAGEIVGYVYAALEGPSWRELRDGCGYIEDIVVRDAARRSGVATALLTAALDWLRACGAPRVLLVTATANDAAHQLFGRLGFRRTMVEMTCEL